MPIYEYECGACGRIFEELVLNSDETICCPDCKTETVKKLMSTPADTNSNGLSGLGSLAGAGGCGSGGFT